MKSIRTFFVSHIILGAGASVFLVSFAFAQTAAPRASLYVAPASGTYEVGSTFTVSVYINTHGNAVNAVEAELEFPAGKLQVVAPTAGKSQVQIWIDQPSYDNASGRLKFQGAIPSPGINSSAALISQVTFRVTDIGTAFVRFRDSSRVLLNDGKGTDILADRSSGAYRLVLPPPAGPIVSSPTHPDQERWYQSRSVAFEWEEQSQVDGYSFVLDENPVGIPDDITDGTKTNHVFQNIPDGERYFHIKALRGGVWGGVTHYAAKIDSVPPAEFPVTISPSGRTVSRRPSVVFETTDEHSGIDRYEIRLIPLDPGAPRGDGEPFFISAHSPYLPPELSLGDYDVVVRAHDRAGNVQQITRRLEIVSGIFEFIEGKGIRIHNQFLLPWWVIFLLAAVLILIGGIIAVIAFRHHRMVDGRYRARELPEEVVRQLDELRTLKSRYGSGPGALILLLLFGSLFSFVAGGATARAEDVLLGPPVITLVSGHISNTDIFYAGGRAEGAGGDVRIYLQDLERGGTEQYTAAVDRNGDWFYSHPTFLASGKYLLWTQLSIGSVLSPPGPQVELTVSPAAIQLGASRISYEALYLTAAILLFGAVLALLWFSLHHHRTARRKSNAHARHIEQISASLQKGFVLLKRDLQHAFAFINDTKRNRSLTDGERALEARIAKDLSRVEQFVRDEFPELEREAEGIES